MKAIRKIIHIYMNVFYASVEQQDRPELKGKPVIVGGDPKGRGVVATCSYEARKFGIHSAMPASRAYRLCPQAIFLRPRFDRYRAISLEIMTLFEAFSDRVEPLSLDEAFLDVSADKKGLGSATLTAREILSQIQRQTGLTASAGVSYNKFLAKVASDMDKPNGITIVKPEEAEAFIENLPIRKFFGIGPKTEKRMLELGIKTGADLKDAGRDRLVKLFGKAGDYYYQIAMGEDDREVSPERVRKSVGRETTLQEDLGDIGEMLEILDAICVEIVERTLRKGFKGKTITLKIRYHDFKTITRSRTLDWPLLDSEMMRPIIRELLEGTEAGGKKVRLLGVTVSNHEDEAKKDTRRFVQLPLPFPEEFD